MADDDGRPRQPFPVVLAVRRTYELLFGNFGTFLRVCGPWAVVLVASHALLRALPQVRGVDVTTFGVLMLLVGLAAFAAAVCCATAVATRWHRTLHPSQAGSPYGGVVRYGLIALLLLSMLVVVPQMLFGVAGAVTFDMRNGWLAWIASTAGAAVISARFALVLPGALFSDPRLTLRASWALTHGNGMRLLAGALAAIGPALFVVSLITGLVAQAFDTTAEAAGIVARTVRPTILWLFAAGLASTYTTLCYRFFVEGSGDLQGGGHDTLRDTFK
jgi:hypothetical protein